MTEAGASRISIGGNSADCVDVVTTTVNMCRDAQGNEQIDNGEVGNGCVGVSFPRTYTTYYIDMGCLAGGGGGGGFGPGSGGGNPGSGGGNPGSGSGGGYPGGGGGGGSDSPGDGSPGYSNPGNPDEGNGNGGNPDNQNPSLGDNEGNPILTTPILTVGAVRQFVQSLSAPQQTWWNSNANAAAVAVITAYLSENSTNNAIDEEAKAFTRWAVEYLMTRPNITIAQFQNWFMTPNEGKDFFYDEAFWENPNLSFPQQNLPSWNDFKNAYPSQSSAQLYGVVGGEVAQAQIDYPIQTANGCALKVSRALNYSGITIPQITTTNGYPGTLQGADGKYYFLNAKSLNKWMKETFGTNPETDSTPLNENHFNFSAEDGGINGENFP
ncbi:MAG TPA: T6SS effector amidase Tae4 family protein, partial [Flavobacterium sp.]|nr:T6SS effector amidase Tae4 family protein [Flavobacterium sp.]